MIKRTSLVLGLVLACASVFDASANANVKLAEKTGNGGGAWVCRESNGKIRWSKLVDLFEAENEFGLTLAKYPGQVRGIVRQVQGRLSQANPDLNESLLPWIEALSYLESNPPKILYTEDKLAIVDDSLFRLEPGQKRCVDGTIAYEQVVNYKVDGMILLQSEIFNSLPLSERAALVFHEAIYAFLREYSGAESSVTSRRIVGLIFSTLAIQDLKEELDSLDEAEIGGAGMKFVSIPAGSFLMGSPENEPDRHLYFETQHLVTLTKGYEIQNTEVTQSLWVQIMKSNPSTFKEYENCPKTHKIVDTIQMCPMHPIENITMKEIETFISRLNDRGPGSRSYSYRLPTEAEWEYAARAGTQTTYFFGNDPSLASQYAYISENSKSQTQNVRELKPNPWGLYDMYGNVWEYVSDRFGEFNKDPTVDPTGPDPSQAYERVRRGGCWYHLASSARSASRWRHDPEEPSLNLGFRFVRTRK